MLIISRRLTAPCRHSHNAALCKHKRRCAHYITFFLAFLYLFGVTYITLENKLFCIGKKLNGGFFMMRRNVAKTTVVLLTASLLLPSFVPAETQAKAKIRLNYKKLNLQVGQQKN